MNLREIVTLWLEASDYDGLAGDNCGCELDDLMPCDEPNIECQPGYKRKCPGEDKCPDSEECPAPNTGIVCMSTKKPKP